MKIIRKITISLLTLVLVLTHFTMGINAATNDQFDVHFSAHQYSFNDTGGDSEPNLDGEVPIAAGAKLNPGDEFRLSTHITPPKNSAVNSSAISLQVLYDSRLVELITDGGDPIFFPFEANSSQTDRFDFMEYAIFPARGTSAAQKRQTNHELKYAFPPRSNVTPALPEGHDLFIITMQDNPTKLGIAKAGIAGDVFFRVKADAPENAEIKFTIRPESLFQLPTSSATVQPFVMNVAGEEKVENNAIASVSAKGQNHPYDYLEGVFSESKTNYNLVLPNYMDTFALSHVLADPGSGTRVTHGKVTSTGTSLSGMKLDVGDNYFKTVVSSSTGQFIKEYMYTVRRLSTSTNVSVTGLDSNSKAVIFDSSGETTVLRDATAVDVLVNTNNSGATYVVSSTEPVNGNRVTINLTKSETPFSVAITPESLLSKYDSVLGIDVESRGVIENKDFKLKRASDDTSLTSVTIKNSQTSAVLKQWNETLNEYALEVGSDVTSVDIEMITTQAGASIMTPGLTDRKLVPGMNSFNVQVNAPDGTQKFYSFKINRVKQSEAKLGSLSVKVDGQEKVVNGSFTENNVYEVDYSLTSKTTITAVADSLTGSKIESGNVTNSPLVVGDNTYDIVVVAEDGVTKKTYKVTIKVAKNSDSSIGDGGLLPETGNDNWLEDKDTPIIDESIPGETDQGVSIHRHTINVLNKKKTFGMSDLSLNLPDGAVHNNPTVMNLLVGANEFIFEVTSQDGIKKSRYIITVNRGVGADSITVTPGIRSGDLETGLSYALPSTAENYVVDVVVSSGSIVAEGAGTFPVSSNSFDHIVRIRDASGSITKTYTIKMTREASQNNQLAELVVQYPGYDEDVFVKMSNQAVSIDVPSTIDKVTILPKTEHFKSTFTIAGTSGKTEFELGSGENEFEIIVTPETGATRTYILTVNKLKSADAFIETLSVNDVKLTDWNRETTDYTLIDEVGETVSSLKFNYVLSSGASAVVENNSLIAGQETTVRIVVTAADGKTKKTYSIKATRAKSTSVDIEDGGLKPDNPGHELNPGDTDYDYTIYVPRTKKQFSQNDIKLTLKEGQTVEYGKTITLTGVPANDKYTFSITAQDGVNKQIYTITVIYLDADLPKITEIFINDVKYTSYDPLETKPIIDLDPLIGTAKSFEFRVVAEAGAIITDGNGSGEYLIEVTGKDSMTQTTSLIRNGAYNAYQFKFTRTLSTDNGLDDVEIVDKDGKPFLPPYGQFEPPIGSVQPPKHEIMVPDDQDKITITPNPKDPNSNISGGGEIELIPGDNEIIIETTPEDGGPSEETIIIVKRELKLEELEVGSTVVDVSTGVKSGNTLTFTLPGKIDSSITEQFVKAVANHSSVTISGDANKIVALNGNSFNFVLTAKDGKTKLSVVVNYLRDQNTDARLKTLELKLNGVNFTPTFNPDVNEYEFNVDYDVSELLRDTHFVWTTMHPSTVVSAPEKVDLVSTSDNKYVISTTAEDGVTKRSYTFTIKRAPYNYLEFLTISSGDGHLETMFDKDTLTYDAMVYAGKNRFSFDWSVKPGVSVVNESALKNISTASLPKTFEVQVKGDNDEIRTYSVNVTVGVSTRLKSMESSLGILNFDADTYDYTILVDKNATNVDLVNVVAEDSTAMITGNYTDVSLVGDTTSVVIKVSNGGYESDYTVNFKKTDDQTGITKVVANDGPNRWESTINGDGKFEILVNSDTDLAKLQIEAILDNAGGSFSVSAGTTDSDYVITVTDKNGIKKDYDLVIKKALSDNNFLASLTIFDKKVPGFNRWATDYEYSLTKHGALDIKAIAEDKDAQVIITDQDGSLITITVTSAKGTDRVYTITIVENFLPELLEVFVNGVKYNAFDSTVNKTILDLDALNIEGEKFDFKVVTKSGVVITDGNGSGEYSFSLKRMTSISHTSSVLKNGVYNAYQFVFTRTLSDESGLDDIVITDESGNSLTPPYGEFYPPLDTVPKPPKHELVVPGDQDKVTITPDPTDPNSKVEGGGEIELVPGDNDIVIKVTPEDGSVSEDTIITIKRELKLNELKIGDIVVDVDSGTLVGNTLTYTLTDALDADTLEVFVKAVANHSSVVISGDANKQVVMDDSSFNFLLTARDGVTKLNVVVNYTREKSTDARLKNLDLILGDIAFTPVFSPDVFEYSFEVGHDVSELLRDTNFSWEAMHPNTMVSAPEKLVLSSAQANKYVISTTAEDGITKHTYTFTVNQGSYNYLEFLAISSGDGHFKDIFDKESTNFDAMIYAGKSEFSFNWVTKPGVSVVNESELKNINTADLPKTFEIKVKGDSDGIRSYFVNVDVGVSTRLASMESSVGVLDFKPETNDYLVFVDVNTTEVSLINVVAEDINATISNNHTNIPLVDEETSVVVNVKNGGNESNYTVKFKKGDDETGISKIIANDGPNRWESTVNDDGKFEIIVNTDTEIADLDFEAKLEVPGGTVVIGEGVMNSDGYYDYVITVTDKFGISKDYDLVVKKDTSDNNFLQSLTIHGKSIPGFNRWATAYEYKLTQVGELNIVATAEDPLANVSIVEPVEYVDGAVIEITVTSQKGNTRVYRVSIAMDALNTAVLSHLSVKEAAFSPQFNPNQSQYYMSIPNELEDLTVQYLAVDGGTVSLSLNGIDSKTDLVKGLIVGSNTIDVKVKALDGTEFTYTIYVKRSEKANNFLDSLVVKETDGTAEYAISPVFSKVRLSYTVKLPNGVNAVTVGADFDDTLKVHGLDDLVISQFPYVHKITVLDYQNVSRVYDITFEQEASDIVTLADLRTSEGALDPVFDANRYVYNIDVPYSVNSLELEYTTNHADQIVTGVGVKTIKTGRNEFIVTVKSGNSSQSYTIFVNRANVSTPGLDWLEVSDGVLSPEFNSKVKKYHVTVDDGLENITINAGSNSSEVTVKGSGDKTLNPGSNVFPITVDAGAGVIETYYVVVNRGEIAVDNLLLAHLSITDEVLNEIFDPLELAYTADLTKQSYDVLDVIAIAQNPLAEVTITGNMQLSTGEHLINIRVQTADGAFRDTTITVNLGLRLLQSDIHTVGDAYIATVSNEQTVKDLKDQMLNENHELRVYSEGSELSDDELVGTGAIIKLVVDLVEYDSKVIVVLGDVNGDGSITVADLMMSQSYILGNDLTEVQKLAADATLDGDVTVADFMMIQAHILQQINIHGPKEVVINE